MLYDAYRLFHDYLKDQRWWRSIESTFLTVTIYVMIQIGIHEGLERSFEVKLPVRDYLSSYIFRQASLLYLGVAFTVVLLIYKFGTKEVGVEPSHLVVSSSWDEVPVRAKTTLSGRALAARLASVWIIVGILFVLITPKRVSQVRIKYLDDIPGLNIYALDYIIAELNKKQNDLVFELDYDVLKRNGLTAAETRQVADPSHGEINAARLADSSVPLIAITPHRLGDDFFWQCDKQIAVISTFGWENLEPPSVYEYVTYSIIVQSLLLNLDRSSMDKTGRMLTESSIVDGRLAQFSPRRHSVKAEILAAHLSPELNRLLMNKFGLGYVTSFSSIISLEWLRSSRIVGNLERSYGIHLTKGEQ